jgi:hypothetical protein
MLFLDKVEILGYLETAFVRGKRRRVSQMSSKSTR